MNEPGLIDHLLALLLGVIIPAQSLFRGDSVMEEEGAFTSEEKFAIYKINSFSQWVLTLLVLAVWWLKERPMSALGLHLPDWAHTAWVLLLIGSFVAAFLFDSFQQINSPESLRETREEWKTRTPFMPVTGAEFRQFLLVVVTAAVCEEILFRGFLINYLAAVFEPTGTGLVFAVMLPSVVFAVSHLYQGWESVAKIAVLSVVFGSLFVLTGSLLLPAILHFLVNLTSAWLSWRFVGREPEES
ncbi:MAG TPA: CPBP family intramembrane metalloprotease [Saprospiraceae bacterium]|nr:CPBP family intramembrane metalloprotease [Saprospiraceae bacterium]